MLERLLTHNCGKHVQRLLTIGAVLTSLLVTGCATVKLDEAAWRDQRFDVVWPQAPEIARIRFQKEIRSPQDVVTDSKGVVKKIFEYVSGHKEEYVDFYTPQCIAADGNGVIFIADPSLGIVHKYDLAAKKVQYITNAGDKKLGTPVGVALDHDGNLFVSDSQLAAVFKYNSDGEFLHAFDGNGALKQPAGIAITSKGDKVVADISADKVFVFDKNDALKSELTLPETAGKFNRPTYVALDRLDNVYVTDTMNFTVRVFAANGTYLRSLGQIGDVPGTFARPKGVAVDSDQNVYVLDAIFGNFQIFDQKDRLLLYVGHEGELPGEFMLPSGIYIDRDDRIYIADTFNHRIQVYQYLKEKVRK
jgi:sugar lactone lactonase YvrE